MKARPVAFAALVTGVALALAGCSGSGGSGASSDEKITISYWTHVNPPAQDVENKLIAQYEQEHPNITIDYQPVDFGSLITKVNSSIAGGGGPDLLNFFQSFAAGLDAKGYLAPVDFSAYGVADQSTFESAYGAGVLSGYMSGDKIIGVPHEVSTYQWWVNDKAFAAAGLDPVKDFPKSWDDVATTGSAIQAAGITEGLALSVNAPVRDSLILDAMAKQAGQALFSDDGKTAYVNSPQAVRALTTWGNFVTQSKINNPSLGPTATTNAEDLFGAGTAGMVGTAGSYFEPTLSSTYPDIQYTVGQYPTFDGNNVGADLYGFGLYVPVTSQHQQAAWQFAKFLSDNADAYFTGAGIWLGQDSLSDSATSSFANWDVFQEGFTRGSFLAPLTNYNEISQSLENAIQRVVLNGQSAQDSLDQAQSEIEPLLAQ